MVNMNGLSLEIISHPGETIQELLEMKNMTQKELALRLSCTPKHINEVIKGVKPISTSLAEKLENVFEIKSSFWNNLQNIYNSNIEKLKIIEEISIEEIMLVKENMGIVKHLENEKLIENHQNISQKTIAIRKFLNISDLMQIKQILQTSGCYRISNCSKINEFALAIWLKICEKTCEKVETINFQESYVDEIKQDVVKIKELSVLEPSKFLPLLKNYFAQKGISFCVVKNIKGAPVNGYIKKNKYNIMLCLTIRGSDADKFWFTLFHELGHLITKKIDKTFIDYETHDCNNIEKEADLFANLNLIDSNEYEKLKLNGINQSNILEFAKSQKILPSIVVGRLQHDKIIPFSHFNQLKTKYIWQ